jgi:hypothetical protein
MPPAGLGAMPRCSRGRRFANPAASRASRDVTVRSCAPRSGFAPFVVRKSDVLAMRCDCLVERAQSAVAIVASGRLHRQRPEIARRNA